MTPSLRKIIALPVLLILLLVVLAPHVVETELMVVHEPGCCAHGNQSTAPEGTEPVADCPLCSIISIDLPILGLLKIQHAEFTRLGASPGALAFAHFPSSIDWPPEAV